MKLSIIIPCYNCEKTVEEAVNSIYKQNLDVPFEIIMVDDKSTDNTKLLIEKLSNKNTEIRFFYHQKNLGGGAARNTAVSKSKGDIIFCLDSDDLLPPNTLPKMLKCMDERKCDGITIHKSIKFKGENINDIHHIEVSPYINKKITLADILSKNAGFNPLYVNFMYTRSSFDKVNGYPTTHGYDTQGFAWRFLCAGLNAYTCPDTEYLHRIQFNESYFLREYNNGKINYNWRDILIEHYYIFDDKVLEFICKFDCKNFTRGIMDSLLKKDKILKSNYEELLGKKYTPLHIKLEKNKYIKRNSPKGYYLRIMQKLNKISNKVLEKLTQIFQKIYRYSYSFFVSFYTKRITKMKFKMVYSEMKKLYKENRDKYNFSDFVLPEWNKNMIEIEYLFLNNFSFSFLNYSVIKKTMFMYTHKQWRNIQKTFISKYFGKNETFNILQEYNLGKPLLNDMEYATSGNNIHHLYHLVKFFKETQVRSSDINTIVEIGGGYGNMAKIYKKINPNSTYIIIDIPVFSYIQSVYLKTIYGSEAVHFVHNNEITIKTGLINIIPLDMKNIYQLKDIIQNTDLFISTWALSESNKNMQDYVKDMDYFKAKYLLLAYQKSSDSFAFAEDIKNITEKYKKIFNQETEYVKNNYYLFCERQM